MIIYHELKGRFLDDVLHDRVGGRWDEKAGLQARYLSVPINNELDWLNGGQP